jgi:hypothetical protein
LSSVNVSTLEVDLERGEERGRSVDADSIKITNRKKKHLEQNDNRKKIQMMENEQKQSGAMKRRHERGGLKENVVWPEVKTHLDSRSIARLV